MSVLDQQVFQEQKAVEILSVLLRKGKVPHALLFTGIEGIGKRTLALMFAMALNCRRFADRPDLLQAGLWMGAVAGCDCKSCRKIRSGSHPDIHRVAAAGAVIKIDQVRELCHTISMKPFEAAVRVVIIEGAQAMNPESSNALLKVLEEPPDRTVFVLTAVEPRDLAQTIVSRCQKVGFHPVSRGRLAAAWRKKYDIPPGEADILAAMAEGGPCRIDMALPADRSAWIKRRSWIIGRLSEIMTRKGQDLSVNGLLAVAERLARKKAAAEGSLDVIRSWLRDLIVCRHCPEKIFNQDALSDIQRISLNYTEISLLSKIEAVDAAQRDLRSNANVRLTLEVMVLQLAKK
ncbi:DNA polymerase III subunit delta' [Desulfococcus sp.]|uniref:DNA polymerase III subunit delta' n=1 Tax=Desulfococcus sp. TaxID=2025834 RepID=UPI003593EDD3